MISNIVNVMCKVQEIKQTKYNQNTRFLRCNFEARSTLVLAGRGGLPARLERTQQAPHRQTLPIRASRNNVLYQQIPAFVHTMRGSARRRRGRRRRHRPRTAKRLGDRCSVGGSSGVRSTQPLAGKTGHYRRRGGQRRRRPPRQREHRCTRASGAAALIPFRRLEGLLPPLPPPFHPARPSMGNAHPPRARRASPPAPWTLQTRARAPGTGS